MREELYAEIFEMEQHHWWFAARHQIILHLLDQYLPRRADRRNRVADLGCGCGMMLHRLAEHGYDAVGMDGSEQAVAFSKHRGVDARFGRLPSDVPLTNGAYDAVLFLDVLEHLSEDRASAEVAVRLLRPGGVLICTVPAHPWLWTKRDEHHHHFRRYSRSQFAALFAHPDLDLLLLNHLNAFLFIPAAVWRLGVKATGRESLADLRLPPRAVNRAFKSIFAFERNLVCAIKLPIGLSFIAVARRQNSAQSAAVNGPILNDVNSTEVA